MYKVLLKYSLVASGSITLISSLLFVIHIDYKPIGLQMILIFIVFGIVIVFALREFKKRNNELLTLSKAMLIGLSIATLGSLIIVLWIYAFTKFINPDFYFEAQKEYNSWNHSLLNPELSPEEVAADTNAAIDYIRESVYTSLLRGNIIVSGCITTLLAGLIMKKSKIQ